jgi:hypothetical protein
VSDVLSTRNSDQLLRKGKESEFMLRFKDYYFRRKFASVVASCTETRAPVQMHDTACQWRHCPGFNTSTPTHLFTNLQIILCY